MQLFTPKLKSEILFSFNLYSITRRIQRRAIQCQHMAGANFVKSEMIDLEIFNFQPSLEI